MATSVTVTVGLRAESKARRARDSLNRRKYRLGDTPRVRVKTFRKVRSLTPSDWAIAATAGGFRRSAKTNLSACLTKQSAVFSEVTSAAGEIECNNHVTFALGAV